MLGAACEADRASLNQMIVWHVFCSLRYSQDGEDYANSINALFLEASARTGANVQQIFEMAGTVLATWFIGGCQSCPHCISQSYVWRSLASAETASAGAGSSDDLNVGDADGDPCQKEGWLLLSRDVFFPYR